MKTLLTSLLLAFSMVGAHAQTITLNYPNGGETFVAGQNVTLKWDNADLDQYGRIAIIIYSEPYSNGTALGANLVIPCGVTDPVPRDCSDVFNYVKCPDLGICLMSEYTVTLPRNVPSGNYKAVLYIMGETGGSVIASDQSGGYFSVVTNEPSIRIRNDIDQHWVAGTVHGVAYNTLGIAPGVLSVFLIPTNQADGGIRMSSNTSIPNDGNDGDAFNVWFTMPSGSYNIMLVASSDAFPHTLFTTRGTGVITVSSTIVSPAAGENQRRGKTYTAIWVGREPRVDYYTAYLINVYTGKTLGAIFLGRVEAQKGSFTYTIPHKVPPGPGYRIWFVKADGYGVTSDDFNIVHDNRKSTRF